MDSLLQQFYRQYLQQVINLTYPPSKLLGHPDIQSQIYRYFFNQKLDPRGLLPPPEYQRRVLKRLLGDIVKGIKDEDDEVSDDLMAHMGHLSSLPKRSDLETTQMSRTLSYFLPDSHRGTSSTGADMNAFNNGNNNDKDGGEFPNTTRRDYPRVRNSDRILIHESPQLLAAGSNVGLRTWEACLRLSYYLCTSPRERDSIQNANVLELGAGTGLLSLICSLGLKAKCVLATDGLQRVVDGIEANLLANKNQDSDNNNTNGDGIANKDREEGDSSSQQHVAMPLARVLDWTDLSDLTNILSLDNGQTVIPFDYVLGADITYHPELLDPLASLLAELKHRFPDCRILISATVRNEHTMTLWRHSCQNHRLSVREINEVDDHWRCPEYRAQTGLFHEQAFPILIMDIDKTA